MFKVGDLVKPNCFLNFSEIGRVENVIIGGDNKKYYSVKFRSTSVEFEESKLESAFGKEKVGYFINGDGKWVENGANLGWCKDCGAKIRNCKCVFRCTAPAPFGAKVFNN